MNNYSSIAVELVIGLFVLFIITKALGKTQFSEITPFYFISALILGELLGNAVFDPEVNAFQIIFAATLWGFLIFIVDFITQKYNAEWMPDKPLYVMRYEEKSS